MPRIVLNEVTKLRCCGNLTNHFIKEKSTTRRRGLSESPTLLDKPDTMDVRNVTLSLLLPLRAVSPLFIASVSSGIGGVCILAVIGSLSRV